MANVVIRSPLMLFWTTLCILAVYFQRAMKDEVILFITKSVRVFSLRKFVGIYSVR